jgi:hypothetical protein
MARKSSVSRLPEQIRQHIERRVAEGKLTLDELIADLRAAFPAEASAGDLPSRSAMHRYGRKLEQRLTAVKASTEAMRLIREHAGDEMDARSEALTALVQTELFDAILALQEADDPDADPEQRVSMLSAAAKHLATLTRSSVNLKRFQAEAEERGEKRASEKLRAALESMPNKGGVTEDTKRAIRAALGIG